MIGSCSLDYQHGEPSKYPANVGCSNFRYTNNDQSNYSTERHQRKKWIKEDNKHLLHCYFKTNPSQREYRKRIKDIWTESARFNVTSQKIADET